MLKNYRATLIGIAVVIAGMLFYLIMQIFDLWTPGNAVAGPGGFCEYLILIVSWGRQ